ncbi:hypothetical protein [Aliiroseovarius sp.]|uniref:hypothetical protein n=1 Tax=Aliiroseovarius sp. TaxID=1872442 RepID=UPI003BA8B63C
MRFLIFAASLCIATTAQAGRDAPCGSYLEAIGLETELATQDPCSPLEELVITRLDPEARRMDITRKRQALRGDDAPFKLFAIAHPLLSRPEDRMRGLIAAKPAMDYILLTAWERGRGERFSTYKTWFDSLEWQAISEMVRAPDQELPKELLTRLNASGRIEISECTFHLDAFNLPFETLLEAREVRDCLEQAD